VVCVAPSFGERQLSSIAQEEKKVLIPIKVEIYEHSSEEYLYIKEVRDDGLKFITEGNLFKINKKLDEEVGTEPRAEKEKRW